MWGRDMPERNSAAPPISIRLAIAIASGIAYWFFVVQRLRAVGSYGLAFDFTLHWWAGDALRRGYSPYAVINAFSPLYPFCSGYLYFLPTAIIIEPFAYLPMQTAMPVFVGISMAVFGFALTRDGYWRLPFIACAPAFYSAISGQVVPLVTATMLMPSLAWLAPMKYTTALAGGAYTISRKYVVRASIVLLVSIVAFPWWPRQWVGELSDVAGKYYDIPVALTGGLLLLTAAFKWRRPEARMLGVLACLPQTMFFYDQLPLFVIASNYRQALLLAAGSYIAPALKTTLLAGNLDRAAALHAIAPIILCCYYLPCLAIVLIRPNEGRVPAWLDRIGKSKSWSPQPREES
jgi:hypothetical protein